MLIDRLLPHCDFYERHSIATTATPERAYAALRTADLTRSPIVRALLMLRGMRRHIATSLPPPGFAIIGDDPPREIVLGLEGPFWRPDCRLHDVDAATFARPVPRNAARGAWNFVFEDGRITTETRVLCADDARAKFRAYWLLVRPFSGLIRRLMLRAIRDEAERAV
ncbi:MAG TPA: hypothetical protein VHK90_04625 [Thermoanaerobaculia bacterium]|nr:hypothetical protein [Thermoanaerobaculia bacterium]